MVYFEPVGVVVVVDHTAGDAKVMISFFGLVSDLMPPTVISYGVALIITIIAVELAHRTVVIVFVQCVALTAKPFHSLILADCEQT